MRQLLLLLPIGLIGCVRTPEVRVDRLLFDPPATYVATVSTQTVERFDWLRDFDDPSLRAVLTESLSNNYNLQVAAARLESSDASRRMVRSGFVPTIQGNLTNNRQKNNFRTLPIDLEPQIIDFYNLNVGAAWEVDLWGKVRNRYRGAIADWEAAQSDFQALRFSLGARTARLWFDAIQAALQLELAESNVQTYEQNLKVVEGSYQRGLPNRSLDLRLTTANLEAARSSLALRQRDRDIAVRSLETLLGRYPSGNLKVAVDLPNLSQELPPVGLPSELLLRRPDLLAAERRVAASLERVRVAQKDLLPTFSLSGGTGTTTREFRELLDHEALLWNVAGNLVQPIFQGGRLIAGISLAKASHRQALAAYADAVLNAFLEVEVLLVSEGHLHVASEAAQKAASEAVAAQELAQQHYQNGLVNIVTVLEAQRRSLNARSALIDSRHARLINRINLYLALGGDFGYLESDNDGVSDNDPVIRTDPVESGSD